MTQKTLFQKILDGEIPAKFVHKDDVCGAFHDINPQAPVHVLIVPRKPLRGIDAATPEDQAILGHLLVTAKKLADQLGLAGGYRLVVNNGPDGQQSVPHLHIHLLGGRLMSWPPG